MCIAFQAPHVAAVAQIPRCPWSGAGNRPREARPWDGAVGDEEHSSRAGRRSPALPRGAPASGLRGVRRPEGAAGVARVLAEAGGALSLCDPGLGGSPVEEATRRWCREHALRKGWGAFLATGFPGAEVGKANRSWPGEERLEEYSRERERRRRGVAELISDKLSQEFWGLKEGSFLFFCNVLFPWDSRVAGFTCS